MKNCGDGGREKEDIETNNTAHISQLISTTYELDWDEDDILVSQLKSSYVPLLYLHLLSEFGFKGIYMTLLLGHLIFLHLS